MLQMTMRKVYIAHAYGGNEENRRRAALWFTWACSPPDGVMAIAPWIILTLVWDESRRAEGMAVNKEQLAECSELWICGSEISPGLQQEIDWANELGLIVEDMRTTDGLPPVDGEPEKWIVGHWVSPLEGQSPALANPDAGKYMPTKSIEVIENWQKLRGPG